MQREQFSFHMPAGAQDGVAASDDRLYRWAAWRFWDVSKPYIVFVGLNPRAARDPVLEDKLDGYMRRWERGPQADWLCGGYVVVSLFGRVAFTAEHLRRLHVAGVDIVGQRTADAVMVFARNPACRMVVMLPGVDDMLDVRASHQSMVLDALTGLGKHIATVGPDGMPREWKR